MRFQLFAIVFAGTAVLGGTGMCGAQAPGGTPSPLPVKRVVFFTSGVAYTERTGEVDGDASVPLVFRTGQINDILKSMVLLDERGRVQPATYAAKDPIGHALQAFAVDVTQTTSLAEILNRMRGARVSVDAGGKEVTGQIVGVEERRVGGDDAKPLTAPFLNLLTETGIASVRLDTAGNIRILDERLNREFHEALTLLASGSDDQRRQVLLHFAGNGRRGVQVGYVTEAPLWKMSYRLMMGGAKAGQAAAKPYLQGWAMVENTTDEDWTGVRLSLVSGRPVSFIQDLYQPLYLPRPVVAPDVIASPYPQTHAGNLDENRKVAELPARDQLQAGVSNRRPAGRGAMMGGAGGFGGGGAMGPMGERADAAANAPAASPGAPPTALGVDNTEIIRNSVQAQASGQSAGELFEYNIATPVTLPRQQAAMIPVVAQDVTAEKVSLYNADSDARFPLNAIRVHNTTSLHLKGGPITLFDEGVYAGDAKMEDIPPGDSRLVSYAVDLSIEGDRKQVDPGSAQMSYSIKRGVLIQTWRQRQETVYTLKSKADKVRTVLVEHPYDAQAKLIAPLKADERTAGLYRFAVAVPAGESKKLTVVTERPISNTIGILDTDLNTLVVYAGHKDVPQKVREALQQVAQRRQHAAELKAQASSREGEIGAIMQDQERIRKNMAALDKTSALYKRYVSELDRQETRIEALREDAAKLRRQAADAEAETRAFVESLTITE